MRFGAVIALLFMGGCASSTAFHPKSEYPPDPWVKGYSNPDDCLGGEKLAAREFNLPDYPKRAFKSGRQGWVIMKLDVLDTGETANVSVERSLPEGLFERASKDAVKAWRFQPPQDGGLENCRVLLRYKFGRVSLGG